MAMIITMLVGTSWPTWDPKPRDGCRPSIAFTRRCADDDHDDDHGDVHVHDCHHFDHPNILFLVGGPCLTRPNHCGKDSGQHMTFKKCPEKNGTYIYDGGFSISIQKKCLTWKNN